MSFEIIKTVMEKLNKILLPKYGEGWSGPVTFPSIGNEHFFMNLNIV
jgi:hypothetical protein